MATLLSKDEQDNTECVLVPTLSPPTFQKFKESNPHLRVCVQHTKNEIEVSVDEFIYTDALKSITLLSPLSTIDKINKNLLLEIINSPSSFLIRTLSSACGRQTGEIIRQVGNWNIANGNQGVVIGQTRFRINAVALPPAGGKRAPACSYIPNAQYAAIPINMRNKRTCPQIPSFVIECRSYGPGSNNTQATQWAKCEMFIMAGVQTALLIDGPALEHRYYCATPAAGAAPLIPGAIPLAHNNMVSCLTNIWPALPPGGAYAPAVQILGFGAVAGE
eukprot:Phypoly_transcript_11990.p1 GENE.Phypoly_transcript_11990~~Phypoly_transcript_11990.p1  ORF type:complete len:276 (+),score=25.24 Phypoly_transcript_11990:57-884(+)